MPTTLRVADIVYYGLDSFGDKRQSWRITHHLKRIEDTFVNSAPDNPVDKIIHRVIAGSLLNEKLKREEAGLPHARRFRYQYCTQEEATHVELVAICGATAPVGECEFIKEVDWPRELIEEQRRNAATSFPIGRMTDWEWE